MIYRSCISQERFFFIHFVPSGEQTGHKAVGNFTVTLNGEVEVIADFNLRKSVVEAGITGMYLLKPTIRIIVNNLAGGIKGTLVNANPELDFVAYVYATGTYTEVECLEQPDQSPSFPTAISNTVVYANDKYTLAFLAPGPYELIIDSLKVEGNVQVVVGLSEEVTVENKEYSQFDFE